MGNLWITYAWKDNESNDVDFIVQTLRHQGVQSNIDRYSLGAGRRLWEQIAAKISDPSVSSAWAIYATENSLQSEACKEELAYALDRALRTRGDEFPIIGVFPRSVTHDVIPPAIRTRLYVRLSDPDWLERIKAAVERRSPKIKEADLQPYEVTYHKSGPQIVIEVRPRIARWYPAIVAVPIDEADRVTCASVDPAGEISGASMISSRPYKSQDGKWHVTELFHEADSTKSVFVFLDSPVSALVVGSAKTPFRIPLP